MLMGNSHALAGDSAVLISVSVATNTQLLPGVMFTQTWTMSNNGTTTWTAGASGYTMNMLGKDSLGAIPPTNNGSSACYPPSAEIGSGESVAPGALATFSLMFIAPQAVGTYGDSFRLNSSSSTFFGPTNLVQIEVEKAGPTKQYDRAKAVSYANNYAGYVVSDGYYWTNGSDYYFYGTNFVPVPDITGDDCAHFVSCCIGSQTNQKGGGLNIASRVPPTYGEPGAQRLIYTNLVSEGYAIEVSSLSQLSPGDVIGWNWEESTNTADIDHVTFYVGNGMIASHADSCLDVSATTWYSDYACHFIHILDATTNTPIITTLPRNLSVSAGSAATFSVSVTGVSPLVYQWEFNGTNLTNNAKITGAQTNVLTLSSVMMSNAGTYRVVVTNAYGSTNVSATLTVTKTTPTITWTDPAAITYGTPLSSNQLNATASVPGSFACTPASGSVLKAGTNGLSAMFTPTDTVDYSSVTDTVSLVVLRAPLTVTASNASRLIGAANPVFSGVIAGLTDGDNITASYSTTATTNCAAGPYPIMPRLVDPNNLETNYSVTLVNGTLTVVGPPVMQTVQNSNGSLTISWSATTNQIYQIQSTASLTPANWTNLSGTITATNSTMTTSEPLGTNAQQFYRVVLLP